MNEMEIRFSHRASGKTTKIKELILEEMKKNKYSLACISMDMSQSLRIKEMVGMENIKIRHLPISMIFSTYKTFHRDLIGQHPTKILFDDIRMNDLLDVLLEGSILGDCEVLMFGSIDSLISDFKNLYLEIDEQNEKIDKLNNTLRYKNETISTIRADNRYLNRYIIDLTNQNRSCHNHISIMSSSLKIERFKIQQSKKNIMKLKKKIRKLKGIKTPNKLQRWWKGKWNKFQII